MKITNRRINSVLRATRVRPKHKLKVNAELVTVPTKIASTFSDHFSSVAQVRNAVIPTLPDDPAANIRRMRKSFVFLNCQPEEINNIILSFESKAFPIDEVPSCIYKKNSDVIALGGIPLPNV